MRTITTAGLAALLSISGPAAPADDRPGVVACLGYRVADREHKEAVKAADRTHLPQTEAPLARIDEEHRAAQAEAKQAYARITSETNARLNKKMDEIRRRTRAAIERRIADAQRILDETIASIDARLAAAGDVARTSGEAQRTRDDAFVAARNAFFAARETARTEEYARQRAALGAVGDERNAIFTRAGQTVTRALEAAVEKRREARERVLVPWHEARAAVESTREAAYLAAYRVDEPTARSTSARVVARLMERHKALCAQILSLQNPVLARGESEPSLDLCARYAEADEVYEEEAAAADTAFHAAKRRIFISHYPEFASDPDRLRHLFGERVRAFNEEVKRVAGTTRDAAKKAARDRQGEAYKAVFADAGDEFPLVEGFTVTLVIRHRGLCRRYQRI